MTEHLTRALAEAQRLTERDQKDLAEIVRAFVVARTGEPYRLSPEEEAAVDEGLAQIERGEFASDEAVEAVLRRPWA